MYGIEVKVNKYPMCGIDGVNQKEGSKIKVSKYPMHTILS